jgi:transporter family-2 protein
MLTWIALACLLGAAACLQGATNGALADRVGLPTAVLLNAAVVFAVALLVWWLQPLPPLPPLQPLQPPSAPRQATPWWLWLGGLYGLFILGAAALVFPRLGAGPATALMVAFQILSALCLDRTGWFGPRLEVTPVRLLGGALLLLGALLVLWPRLRE